MTETILDEGAVSEIEAQSERCLSFLTFGEPTRGNRYVESVDANFYFEENTDAEFDAFVLLRHLPALCATVKHLRWQVDLCEKAFELDGALKLSEVGDLNALQVVRKMVDLQSQLEQLRAENERLKTQRDEAPTGDFAMSKEQQEHLRQITQRLSEDQALIPTRDEADFLLSLLGNTASSSIPTSGGDGR